MPLLLLLGCAQVKTKDYSVYKEGSWEGKALIRNKQKGKSGIVNLKIKSVVDEKLRMDFTSPLGSHIASVLMVGDAVEYLNVADKTLYKTRASTETIRNILLVPLDPKAFYSILFDRPLTGKNWSCTKDQANIVVACMDNKNGLGIEWLSRDGEKRTIQIQNKQTTVQINLFSFDTTVKNPAKAFTLVAPTSFQIKQM